MTTLGDAFVLEDRQRTLSQEILNVFTYRYSTTFTTSTSYSERLAVRWQEQILPLLTAIQTEDVEHTGIKVYNLFDPTDFYETSISVSGDIPIGTSQALPPANAVAYRLATGTRAIKDGQKRFVGLPEEQQQNGVIEGAAYITDCNDLSDGLSAWVRDGLIILDPVFEPIVVKRVKTGTGEAATYRMPKNASEFNYSRVANAILNLLVSTQTSRKIGRGS